MSFINRLIYSFWSFPRIRNCTVVAVCGKNILAYILGRNKVKTPFIASSVSVSYFWSVSVHPTILQKIFLQRFYLPPISFCYILLCWTTSLRSDLSIVLHLLHDLTYYTYALFKCFKILFPSVCQFLIPRFTQKPVPWFLVCLVEWFLFFLRICLPFQSLTERNVFHLLLHSTTLISPFHILKSFIPVHFFLFTHHFGSNFLSNFINVSLFLINLLLIWYCSLGEPLISSGIII